MILSDICPNIYCIVLDIPERKKIVKESLDSMGLTKYVKIFPGVVVNGGQSLVDRVDGCTLAHIELYKMAKRENLSHICIFEDDIMFDKRFNEYLPVVKNFIDTNKWNLFYFGGNHGGRTTPTDNPNVVKCKSILCTHAYMIHSNCYDTAISAYRSNYPIANLLLQHIQEDGHSYCIYPRTAHQTPCYSYTQSGFRDNLYCMEDK
jgi:GR25 family glycosyltransferase involved in LPS biosynthesis